jgi:hypothetical protein
MLGYVNNVKYFYFLFVRIYIISHLAQYNKIIESN